MNKGIKLIGLIIISSLASASYAVTVEITKVTNNTPYNIGINFYQMDEQGLKLMRKFGGGQISSKANIDENALRLTSNWKNEVIDTDETPKWAMVGFSKKGMSSDEYRIGIILDEIKKDHNYKLTVFGFSLIGKKTELGTMAIFKGIKNKQFNEKDIDYRVLAQTESSSGAGLFGIKESNVKPVKVKYKLEITLDGANFEKTKVNIKADVTPK